MSLNDVEVSIENLYKLTKALEVRNYMCAWCVCVCVQADSLSVLVIILTRGGGVGGGWGFHDNNKTTAFG